MYINEAFLPQVCIKTANFYTFIVSGFLSYKVTSNEGERTLIIFV